MSVMQSCGIYTAINCYGYLIIYRGFKMVSGDVYAQLTASGDVYDRVDGYIAKPDDGDRKNKSLDNLIVNIRL